MPWVVDTRLLLDIGLDDPQFAKKSKSLLDGKRADGLLVCPVTFVELAPAFAGQTNALEEFLFNLGIDYREEWTWQDSRNAGVAWAAYARLRRAKQTAGRPVADVLIGAFATRFQGLLTRNPGDFARFFPNLAIAEP